MTFTVDVLQTFLNIYLFLIIDRLVPYKFESYIVWSQSILFWQFHKYMNQPLFSECLLNFSLKAQMWREVQGLAVTSAYLPHCRARGQRLSVGGEGQLCSNSPGIPGWEEEKGHMRWVKEQMISVSWPKRGYFNTHLHLICMHLLLFSYSSSLLWWLCLLRFLLCHVQRVASASLCCFIPLGNSAEQNNTSPSGQTRTFETRFTDTWVTSQYKYFNCFHKRRQRRFTIIVTLQTRSELSYRQIWMIPQNLYQDSLTVLLIWVQSD